MLGWRRAIAYDLSRSTDRLKASILAHAYRKARIAMAQFELALPTEDNQVAAQQYCTVLGIA